MIAKHVPKIMNKMKHSKLQMIRLNLATKKMLIKRKRMWVSNYRKIKNCQSIKMMMF